MEVAEYLNRADDEIARLKSEVAMLSTDNQQYVYREYRRIAVYQREREREREKDYQCSGQSYIALTLIFSHYYSSFLNQHAENAG